jgi:putative YhdH/YhfP family quinone oxidoreductase
LNHGFFRALVVGESEPSIFTRHITRKSLDDLPPGDVLIEVYYSSLNYKDALSASGNKGVTKKYPHTPGIDAAGVVTESASNPFRPGDHVLVTGYDLGSNTSGGFGGYIRVPAGWVVKLPPDLSLRDSMVYGTAGFTAALGLHKLKEHDILPQQGPVLVTGATGGVGSLAVAILAKTGYHVVAATGKMEEQQYLLDLGAREIISRADATDTSGKALLAGTWNGVIDTVGGDLLATAIKSTRIHGAIATCGNVAGPDLRTTVFPFILRGISLLGIDSANTPMPLRQEIWQRISAEWKIENLDRLAIETSLDKLEGYIEQILEGKLKGRVIVNLKS